MKGAFKVFFVCVLVIVLTGLISSEAVKSNNRQRTISLLKPPLVLVKASAIFDVYKKKLGAYARLKYKNAALTGWKVTFNNMKMSYKGNGLYKLPNMSYNISPGTQFKITMVPPRTRLIPSPSKPIRPKPKFQTIIARGRIGKPIFVTYPKNNAKINLAAIRTLYLKITWNINKFTEFYLSRVGFEGLYYDENVSGGGSFNVPKRKLKPASRYKISLHYFPMKGSFSVPVDKQSFFDIVMSTESYFSTTALPLPVRR